MKTEEQKQTASASEQGFEERLKKIEAFVAAIPAWKEAQMQVINDTREQSTDRANEILSKVTNLDLLVKESDRVSICNRHQFR